MCFLVRILCCHSFLYSSLPYAEGNLEISDVSGLSYDLPFLPSLFFFCLAFLRFLSCQFSANGPFSLLFSPEASYTFSLRVRLYCMALVEQLGDDSW